MRPCRRVCVRPCARPGNVCASTRRGSSVRSIAACGPSSWAGPCCGPTCASSLPARRRCWPPKAPMCACSTPGKATGWWPVWCWITARPPSSAISWEPARAAIPCPTPGTRSLPSCWKRPVRRAVISSSWAWASTRASPLQAQVGRSAAASLRHGPVAGAAACGRA